MGINEITVELETLNVNDLRIINNIVCELVASKLDWEAKKVLQKLEVGAHVTVRSSQKGDFKGIVLRIMRKKALIQVDGSSKQWIVPGDMIVIGEENGNENR